MYLYQSTNLVTVFPFQLRDFIAACVPFSFSVPGINERCLLIFSKNRGLNSFLYSSSNLPVLIHMLSCLWIITNACDCIICPSLSNLKLVRFYESNKILTSTVGSSFWVCLKLASCDFMNTDQDNLEMTCKWGLKELCWFLDCLDVRGLRLKGII